MSYEPQHNKALDLTGRHRPPIVAALCLLCFFVLPGLASAQDEDVSLDFAPPVKAALAADLARFRSSQDPKDRARVALVVLDERLRRAETLAEAGNTEAMFGELGGFSGLMDAALVDLLRYDEQGKQSLSSLKRYDLGLRAFLPRLEILRRTVPYTHEYYLKYLMKQLQDVRGKALEPMFDDTVIRMPNR